MKNNLRQSFSLVEVLIFVTILGLFFVAAAAITLVSLRNMKINEHKIIATHYAEELLSWLQSEKDANWNTIYSKTGTYCFKESPIISWVTIGDCGSADFLSHNSLSTIFKRKVIFSKPNPNPLNQININITVSWNELGNTYSVPLRTVFTVWE